MEKIIYNKKGSNQIRKKINKENNAKYYMKVVNEAVQSDRNSLRTRK